MNFSGLEIGWPNILAGLALAGAFTVGVWLGSKWNKKEKKEWPTPYPRLESDDNRLSATGKHNGNRT